MASVLSCSVLAESLPEPVDGVLTLSVALGTTTYDDAVPATVTKVVKTGAGEALLTKASTFAGEAVVSGGTLSISDYAALGSMSSVTVENGATFDLKGRHSNNQLECLFAKTHALTIAGTGVGGNGALRFDPNSALDGATPTDCCDGIVQNVSLSANASIGGSCRWGFRGGTVHLNGFTLTKKGCAFMFNTTTLEPGTFENAGGILYLQEPLTFTGEKDETVLLLSGGDTHPWALKTPVNAKIVLAGGSFISQGSPDNTEQNVFTGTVKLEGTGVARSVKTPAANPPIRLRGDLDVGSNYFQKDDLGTLYVDGAVAKGRLYVAAGTLVMTSSVARTWTDGIYFIGSGSATPGRLLLGGGTMSTGVLRVGNNSQRGVFNQIGGIYTDTGTPLIGQDGSGLASLGFGAYVLDGGEARFNGSVYVAGMNNVQGMVLQRGGLMRGSVGGSGTFNLCGGFGTDRTKYTGYKRVTMHVSGGTNDTMDVYASGSNATRFQMCPDAGCAELTVSGSNTLFQTVSFWVGSANMPSTNVVTVADGARFFARRFYRLGNAAEGTKFYVNANGGVFMPSFGYAWADEYNSGATFWKKAPDAFTVFEKGAIFDLTSCRGDPWDTTTDIELNFTFLKPEGLGVTEITLPTDATFTALNYYAPVQIDIEGPGHGATAYADVDYATHKLAVKLTSTGCGYDETTKVYVYSPDLKSRYECGRVLGTVKGGPLVKRGPSAIKLFGENTYSGGTIVEGGAIRFYADKSFPSETALLVKAGASVYLTGAATVSRLSGGGWMTAQTDGATLTVTEAIEISAKDLFSDGTKLSSDLPTTLGENVKLVVKDPENLSQYEGSRAATFLTCSKTLDGSIPTVELPAGASRDWTVRRSGNKLLFGCRKGIVILFR